MRQKIKEGNVAQKKLNDFFDYYKTNKEKIEDVNTNDNELRIILNDLEKMQKSSQIKSSDDKQK